MNKRNTEGYVLAYLLIVIAVMGAIAATLMTSTVQVMAAQQNSIRYMQDKYEAMGEVEKLVAELEYELATNAPEDSSDYAAKYYRTNIESSADAFAEVIGIIDSLLVNSTDSSSDTDGLELNVMNARSAELQYVFDYNSVSISANLLIPFELIVSDYLCDPYYDDSSDTFIDDDYDYEYTLLIQSPKIISYEITSNGGVT